MNDSQQRGRPTSPIQGDDDSLDEIRGELNSLLGGVGPLHEVDGAGLEPGGGATDSSSAASSLVIPISKPDLAKERGPHAWLSSRPTWLRVVLGMAALVSLGIGAFALMPRQDVGFVFFAKLGAIAMAISLAVFAALRPIHRPPLSSGQQAALWVAAAMLPAALAFIPTGAPQGVEAVVHAPAIKCLIVGTLGAVPLMLFMAVLSRRSSRSAAISAAVAAGLGANLFLENHCAASATGHLILGHAMVVVICAALAWTGAFWIDRIARGTTKSPAA